ncbi:MAG: methionyl-tRNA formyltransferase [Clostridia bacterium]|nr:methionyl-tRNA formyltransferase [Clostridia bacterium]
MTKIDADHLKPLEKSRYQMHKVADATYSVYEIEGEKYFMLDTYGSDSRKSEPKVVQSIMFDKDSAKKMVQLLQDTFWL